MLMRKSIATNLKRAVKKFVRCPEASAVRKLTSYYGWILACDGINLWKHCIVTMAINTTNLLYNKNKVIRMYI